ncbi:MAG: penicillin-binding protein 2 [Kiritimatiellae bacterium]|nr:penicillin-binding protein 2 [Kiritimatiellia bacterium]
MKIEDFSPQELISGWRFLTLAVIFVVGIAILLLRLWNVQVLDSPQYGAAQSAQSFRYVEIPGLRGRIFDRNGEILADNRPSYSVVLYCEELRSAGRYTADAADALIDQLAERLGLSRTVKQQQVVTHVRTSLPMPLVLWQDVDYRTIAYLSEWAEDLPGVAVLARPRRIYPNGALAAHTIGYVGAPGKALSNYTNSGRKWNYRLPELRGRAGLEAQYDEFLSGKSGEENLQVDSRGYTRDRYVCEEAFPGHDLTTTLDVRLQRIAEHALAGRPGAAVALDPRNGDVLAIASAPGYDLNAMIPPHAGTTLARLNTTPGLPFIHRAIQAQYAPGSVFKPFVAIAAQEFANFNPDTLCECTGIYTDYNCRLRCAQRYGHGELDLRQAIMRSCNPYFCTMGVSIGMEFISKIAQQVGFGNETGIDLPAEADGFLPSPEWKLRRHKIKWNPVDTAQCAIGQGAITATPLQVANATAAIAMRGKRYQPRLVSMDAPNGRLIETLPWRKASLDAVIEGMRMTVRSGTGQTMQVEGVDVAGKTGTAEYMDRGVRRKHVWCTAFAPADKPEIVVCVMLDNGTGGGKDAGPVVQKILATHFNTKATQVSADDEALND